MDKTKAVSNKLLTFQSGMMESAGPKEMRDLLLFEGCVTWMHRSALGLRVLIRITWGSIGSGTHTGRR